MREIKFRARTDNGSWAYGFICTGSKDKWYIVTANSTVEVNPNTLGEYTGLNDHKDQPLYEGDTILAYGTKWKIIFSEGAFWAIQGYCGARRRRLGNMYCEVI